jgi:RHS repeat-associated protein
LAHCGDGARSCRGRTPSTSKTVSGDTTEYVLDLAATLPVVISDTEAVYLYGLDIIAQQQSERLYYVHDGLGSVRQLVDTTGQIETNYAYDPFGVPLVGAEVYNPYQFTGEAWDAEVGLLYLRARYYQPEVGRFITKDPWAGSQRSPSTSNRYVYVMNDPVNMMDRSGLAPQRELDLPEPPVVAWIRAEMVKNAQSPTTGRLATLNRSVVWGWGSFDQRVEAKIEAYRIFGGMVRPGGPWDPKSDIADEFGTSQWVGEYRYYYDIWGNIMFGYLGRAAGFTSAELLNGAGLVQIPSDIGYAVQYRDPCRLPRPRPWWHLVFLPATWVFDHPEDRVGTTIGMRLWNAHAVSVQTSHIMNAVLEAGDRGEISRTRDTPSWY